MAWTITRSELVWALNKAISEYGPDYRRECPICGHDHIRRSPEDEHIIAFIQLIEQAFGQVKGQSNG